MFSSAMYFAQNNLRVVYELNFKPNTAKDSLVKDFYQLDIFPDKNESAFYNYNYYQNDSVMAAFHLESERSGGVNIDMNAIPKPKLPLTIKFENQKFYEYKSLDGDTYKFVEKESPTWKILADLKKINAWECQKAETYFNGRKWVAWFTKSVPISTGPYKLRGLPGLIVEVYDEKKDYYFKVISFTKNQEEFYFPKLYSNAILITKEKYIKTYNKYLLDPAAKLRQGTIVDESGNIFHINGGFSKSYIDEVTSERLKKIKEFNNPIELQIIRK